MTSTYDAPLALTDDTRLLHRHPPAPPDHPASRTLSLTVYLAQSRTLSCAASRFDAFVDGGDCSSSCTQGCSDSVVIPGTHLSLVVSFVYRANPVLFFFFF